MAISLGPQGTLVMGMKTEPVNVKLTSETRSVNPRLLSRRNETHLFPRVSAFSRLKETHAFNLRLLYIDDGPGPRAHRSGLVTGFYTTCYIVGIFVTGFPNEDCYSVISVCNKL
jgi:hypothetical protein